MSKWLMLTIIGKDQPGIVGKICTELFQHQCDLGETSMIRLGGNFSMMMMVKTILEVKILEEMLNPVAAALFLKVHIDVIEGRLHQHLEPNTKITVYGADRAGIVAKVTQCLADETFNILNLESDVAGSKADPIYIMQIEGIAKEDRTTLKNSLEEFENDHTKITVAAIESIIG